MEDDNMNNRPDENSFMIILDEYGYYGNDAYSGLMHLQRKTAAIEDKSELMAALNLSSTCRAPLKTL